MAKKGNHRKVRGSSHFMGSRWVIIVIPCLFVMITIYFNLGTNDPQVPEANERVKSTENDLITATKPFEGELFNLNPLLSRTYIWGTLNSGHYFGLKTSALQPIETSIMWFRNPIDEYSSLNIRHLCNQNDGLKFYSWLRHDFHSFGQQMIQDEGFQLETSFLKSLDDPSEWDALIKIKFLNQNQAKAKKKYEAELLSFLQYIKLPNQDTLDVGSILRQSDGSETFTIKGFSKDLGEYALTITADNPQGIFHKSFYVGQIDDRQLVKPFLQSQMISSKKNGTRLIVFPNQSSRSRREFMDEGMNIAAFQMVLSTNSNIRLKFRLSTPINDHQLIDYESELSSRINKFDEKFSRVFPIEIWGNDKVLADRMAKIALSNMIGSIGYFYGLSFIGSDENPNKIAPYGPIQLLSGVPSRSFFPRGFLWDEGFHNLLISEWDPKLSNTIIKSWFDIMNVNGWIPREVILGIESMSRVPKEFIIQRISNANPPAMLLVIERMFDEGSLEIETLHSIYPRLKAWYNWFNETQSGPKPGTFRWRGRDEISVNMLNPKTLTSGLDDYPRASHPSPQEYHLDLRCWMALSARTLAKLANKMADLDYHNQILKEAEVLSDNVALDDLHWSSSRKMFCDYGFNSENVEFIKLTKTRQSADGRHIETYHEFERRSRGNPEFSCVPEFGYVSLFPLLLKVLDPLSDKLGIILDRLRDEAELWSPYGIRSLSKTSRYYKKYNTEHDKPYWRGSIWINLNYLIVSSLEHYSQTEGPHQEKCKMIASELKRNLVENMLNEFSRSHYFWENYDDLGGHGQGSHPFTGWSSLILLIMSNKTY